jgi:cell wall-associated NlpC family hydrolase
MVVNTGVVNLYDKPAFTAPVVTQAILGESINVLDQQGKWFLAEQWDGYQGWIYYFYLVKSPGYLEGRATLTLHQPVVTVRAGQDRQAPGIRDAVYGVTLPVLTNRGPWHAVELPDKLRGWILQEGAAPTGTIREQLVQVAKQFLGTPYLWGGKTAHGFDCSGLVQTVYKAAGVDLPRDAHQQARFADLPDIKIESARPGDLFYFSEDDSITHVAMSLGGAEFVHSSGWVRIESLDSASSNYNHLLGSIFANCKDMSRLIDG